MRFKELINLPVFTQNGKFLGQIKDFEIDENAQEVSKYIVRVRKRSLIQKLLIQELIVHRSQVIFLSQEKMIVDDNLERETKILMEKKSVTI